VNFDTFSGKNNIIVNKMGKKEKNKKKGKGAEKTAEKTQKKMKLKIKKATGEDDIESIVKAIEEEERKRQEVKEIKVDPPSHRSNFSLTAHPEHPELIFFGGEFYSGNKTKMFNDLFIFNTKRKDWTQIKSPAGPPPRSSHQAIMTAQSGGQLWIFGGEFASASESQFHHYRDLWVFHFSSKRWEKVVAASGTPPTSRSGHRMVLLKRHLVIFGGFHDNLSECKYFNDIHVFSLEERSWRKVTISGQAPGPRSGCCMVCLQDGRILIYGGFCKEKKSAGGRKKDAEEAGKTMADMYLLAPEKSDETLSKWRWHNVKKVGMTPCPRSGISSVGVPGTNKVLFFGGVQDVEENDALDDDDDDEDEIPGNFFNDLYSVMIENERATWNKLELSGKKDPTKKDKITEETMVEQDQDIDEAVQNLKLKEEGTTKVVEDGAFTISSTVGIETKNDISDKNIKKSDSKDEILKAGPSPRFGSQLAIDKGNLYLFGGMVEDSNDRQLTHKDFYSIDIHKFDEWEILIESDIKTLN